MPTIIRMVDNFMSESVVLKTDSEHHKVDPHDRARISIPVPVCETAEAFRRQTLELQIPAKRESIRLWEASGHVRFSRDGQWKEDAEPVPRLSEPGGGRGIIVGAMGGFWLKRVNV